MRTFLAVAALIATVFPTASAAQAKSTADDEIRRMDERFIEAMRKADKASLEELIAEGFIWTSQAGFVQTKSQTVSKSPEVTPAPTDRKIRIYAGHTAIVTSSLDVPKVGAVRQIRVWVKDESGKWRIVALQGTRALAKK